jgi:hypothetical protein
MDTPWANPIEATPFSATLDAPSVRATYRLRSAVLPDKRVSQYFAQFV